MDDTAPGAPLGAGVRLERLVVGVDGSPAACAALRWAADVADATGVGIVDVNAFVAPYSEVRHDQRTELIDERRSELEHVWLPAALGTRPADTEVHDGDPRVVLHGVTRSTDLLVLGRTGGAGTPGMFHIGSVVEHAAHHIGATLAVIPSDRHRTIERIVIGVDGSPTAQRAIEWTVPVATAFGATVVAICVERPRRRSTPDAGEWSRKAHDDIVRWTAPLTDAGVHVTPIAHQHVRPADGVLGIASAQDSDLVVAGMRGLGGFTGLRIGGTAMQILHHASRPLVLVPPAPERPS